MVSITIYTVICTKETTKESSPNYTYMGKLWKNSKCGLSLLNIYYKNIEKQIIIHTEIPNIYLTVLTHQNYIENDDLVYENV